MTQHQNLRVKVIQIVRRTNTKSNKEPGRKWWRAILFPNTDIAGDFNSRPGSAVLKLFADNWQITQKGQDRFTFSSDKPDLAHCHGQFSLGSFRRFFFLELGKHSITLHLPQES